MTHVTSMQADCQEPGSTRYPTFGNRVWAAIYMTPGAVSSKCGQCHVESRGKRLDRFVKTRMHSVSMDVREYTGRWFHVAIGVNTAGVAGVATPNI